MWFDSHCHVTADEFAEDRSQVIDRAIDAGVEGLVAIGSGYGVPANRHAVELAARDPRVVATVGVHPHEAKDLDDAGHDNDNPVAGIDGARDHPGKIRCLSTLDVSHDQAPGRETRMVPRSVLYDFDRIPKPCNDRATGLGNRRHACRGPSLPLR